MNPQRLPRWVLAVVALVVCGWLIGPAAAGPVFVTGAGQGGGPHVQVFDAVTGALIFGFFAYAPTFTGGVRVSATDVNGDGVPDVITAPGPGGGPHVRVFDGAALLAGQVVEVVGLFAYNPAFAGGVYIGAATGTECPSSMVRSGPTCIDKYEASVWQTVNPAIIAKIKAGTVTLVELQAAGALQRGATNNSYGSCSETGDACVNIYAVSIPGVTPSRFITWFQAAAAARNAGKRLPTNAEWTAAALGTPDGAPCNVGPGGSVGLTGTAGCVSDVGAFDVVGNLDEWVADWVPPPPPPPTATGCASGLFAGTDDLNCLAATVHAAGTAALLRGGAFFEGVVAGVYAVRGNIPSGATSSIGFRAAR